MTEHTKSTLSPLGKESMLQVPEDDEDEHHTHLPVQPDWHGSGLFERRKGSQAYSAGSIPPALEGPRSAPGILDPRKRRRLEGRVETRTNWPRWARRTLGRSVPALDGWQRDLVAEGIEPNPGPR